MTNAPTLVDFVENALGASAAEILSMVRTRPDQLLARREELLSLLDQTWADTDLEQQQRKEAPGELWPVLPRSAPDVMSLAKTRATSDARFGTPGRAAEASRRDIQSLLLYAHGLHLPNPLRRDEGLDDPTFLNALGEICILSPLITDQVVRVYAPRPAPELDLSHDQTEALDQLASHIGLALMSYEGNRQMHQGHLRAAADILVARALDRLFDVASRNPGAPGSLLMPTPYDAPAVRAVLQTLSTVFAQGDVADVRPDEMRFAQLLALKLPGLAALNLNDMVSIRDDDSFGVFRTDVSAALIDADADIQSERIDMARRTVAEHMDAGLARLHAQTKKGLLADATIGDVVGWGLGAALAASLAGLQATLAALVGKVATDVVRKTPSPGRRALRAHYVELGTPSLMPGQFADVDFLAFDTTALWGPSLGLPRLTVARKNIVQSLLDGASDGEQ